MINILIVGLVAAILFFAQREIYAVFWSRKLKVSLQFDIPELYEGERGHLQEIVINEKKLPLPMLKCKFMTSRNLRFDNSTKNQSTDNYYRNDIFKVGGGEKLTRSLSFLAQKRGLYTIDSYELVASDIFMSRQLVGSYSLHTSIYVLPVPYESSDFNMSVQCLNGEILCRRHLLEDPFEYRGIREYQPYDSMRSINWKATAKTGDFKVNLKDYTSLKVVRIFLNVDDIGVYKKTKCVEASINVAAGLVHNFSRLGIETAFYCNGTDCESGQMTVIEKASGEEHERDIFRALARIDLKKENVSFNEAFSETLLSNEGSLCDCIVSVNGYDDFIELLSHHGNKGSGAEYIWFCPTDDQNDMKLPNEIASRRKVIGLWY